MLKRITLLTLALILSGCGFHLRDQSDLPPELTKLYVGTKLNDPFLTNGIQQALLKSKVTLADNLTAAPYSIEILQSQLSRQFINLSSNAQTRSYELTLRVQYQLQDHSGKALLPPQTVVSQRPWLYNFNQVQGSASEGDTIIQEMYPDIGKQIVERLEAVNTKQALAAHHQIKFRNNTLT